MNVMTKLKIHRERGDTIVEVLIAIAVLGSVLGSASIIVNKNVKTNLATQERAQAVKLAERQLELFRVAVATTPNFLNTLPVGSFCMRLSGTAVTVETTNCALNALGNPTSEEPVYDVGLYAREPAYPLPPGQKPQGRKVHAHIEWNSVTQSGKDVFNYWTEVYQNDYE